MIRRRNKLFDSFKIIKEKELKSLLEDDSHKKLIFRFLVSPEEIKANSEGRIESLTLSKNKLEGNMYCQRAQKDQNKNLELLPAELLITSIGYLSKPIQGIPFDSEKKIIPNSNGCILTEPNSEYYTVGRYCSGWVKSGATGVVDSTLKGATETYHNMYYHLEKGKLDLKQDPIDEIKKLSSGKRVLSFDDWLRVNEEERRLGRDVGKCRVKFNTDESVLNFLDG